MFNKEQEYKHKTMKTSNLKGLVYRHGGGQMWDHWTFLNYFFYFFFFCDTRLKNTRYAFKHSSQGAKTIIF